MSSARLAAVCVFLLSIASAKAQQLLTPFEKNKLATTTYEECISFYKKLAEQSDMIKILEYGESDIGQPVHLVVVSKNGVFDPEEIRKSGKVILFVNNGIHPGEPDGVDACMMLVRDLVAGKVKWFSEPTNDVRHSDPLDRVVLITIPIYNIGGSMNRNDYSRVNQIGPLEYGFRGNAQNRDLNRDFIKCDTKNAMAFVKIFREWKPELFVDTHTTDGADYQYVMTYIATLDDKLEPPLGDYLRRNLIPFLEKEMERRKFPMCPYVVTLKSTPDTGIVEFPETPRYSTGYTALFNTIGFVSETHMLKTHEQRVYATYEFLVSMMRAANMDYKTIMANKKAADKNSKNKTQFALRYQLDSSYYTKIPFLGYEAKYKQGEISGSEQLYYDRNAPYEKEINFYNKYDPVVTVSKPIAYIVPQGWWQVIERLKLNKIKMKRLAKNQYIEVESYYIDTFSTRIPPFEGHYLHSNTTVRKVTQTRRFFAGDYVVYTDQPENNFIVHVLEPQSSDSYFNWNFFDAVLQQKEYYDPYLFEGIADSLLNAYPEVKKEFEEKLQSDEKFRSDPKARLDFIYDNTIREPEYMRYPVGRLVKNVKLHLN